MNAATKPVAAAPLITPALLLRLGVRAPELWAPALNAACARRGIATPLRLAAFLSNVLHETAGFSALVENLNYSAAGLLATWPSRFSTADAQRMGRTPAHPADQRAIAERAYGGRLGNGPEGCGDGFLYRGRGLIQLTGKANYYRFAALIGVPLEDLPALLETREGAAESAAHFWELAKCNALADRGDTVGVRRLVNGGLVGLDDVNTRYAAARAALRC